MKNAFWSVVCVCLSFVTSSPFAQPSDESLASVDVLRERVVEVLEWDLLDPSVDPELVPISPGAATSWAEAAELLDEHASELDELCELFASPEGNAVHHGVARQSARVFRADLARAVELGDRERATRRLAGMLDAARHTMRVERLLIARLSGLSVLRLATEAFEELGPDHFEAGTLRPSLDQLARSKLGWVTMLNQEDEKRRLASLYAAYEIDPRDSLETLNVLPEAFEGIWTGDLAVRHSDDRVFPRVRLAIRRDAEDPRLIVVEYTASNQGSDWFETTHPRVADQWGDGTPEVEHRYLFQREDRASDIWVRVVERDGADGVEYEPIRSTHLTLFSGHRIQIIDLTPMGLSAVGSVMSIQLTDDGAIDFEVQTLEARTITAMPAAIGLWIGRLEREDPEPAD